MLPVSTAGEAAALEDAETGKEWVMNSKSADAQGGAISDDKKAELVNKFRLACEAKYVAIGRIIAKRREGGKVAYNYFGKE